MEIIDRNGNPLLFIEKETGMFYISAMIRDKGKNATNMLNGTELQKYIGAIQIEYNLTRDQVCALRLSPDGANLNAACYVKRAGRSKMRPLIRKKSIVLW